MHTPSSTFSSKSFWVFAAKLGLFCLVCVAAIETLVHCISKIPPEYFYATRYHWVEAAAVKPRVVFMGSSSTKYNLSPKRFAKALGWKPGEAINLGNNAGNPAQAYFAWKALSEKTKQGIRTVFYGFDPWVFTTKYLQHDHFSWTYWNPLQRLYAMVSRHFREDSKREFRNYAFAKNALNQIFSHRFLGKFDEAAQGDDFGAGHLDPGAPIFTADAREDFEPFFLFPVSSLYLSYLQKLKNEVEAGGGRKFILFLPPKSQLYVQVYRQQCGEIDRKIVAELNRYLGPTRVIGSFESIPVPQQDALFRDNVHLHQVGQERFTDFLAEQYPRALQLKAMTIRPLLDYSAPLEQGERLGFVYNEGDQG